jgi:hypothetical protein
MRWTDCTPRPVPGQPASKEATRLLEFEERSPRFGAKPKPPTPGAFCPSHDSFVNARERLSPRGLPRVNLTPKLPISVSLSACVLALERRGLAGRRSGDGKPSCLPCPMALASGSDPLAFPPLFPIGASESRPERNSAEELADGQVPVVAPSALAGLFDCSSYHHRRAQAPPIVRSRGVELPRRARDPSHESFPRIFFLASQPEPSLQRRGARS